MTQAPLIESWFSTVKRELGEHCLSCGEAKMALFDFIEGCCNQRRRHSTPSCAETRPF